MFLNLIRHGFPRRTAKPAPQREISIRGGGYLPNTIWAEAGMPLRLVFRREESSACSEQVVFPAFGKSVTLPEGEQVAVDLPPQEPGEYEFTWRHERCCAASS